MANRVIRTRIKTPAESVPSQEYITMLPRRAARLSVIGDPEEGTIELFYIAPYSPGEPQERVHFFIAVTGALIPPVFTDYLGSANDGLRTWHVFTCATAEMRAAHATEARLQGNPGWTCRCGRLNYSPGKSRCWCCGKAEGDYEEESHAAFYPGGSATPV